MAGSLAASAQEVIVNITPVQQVLPPQVMLYLANPGKYFMLQLTNTTSEPQYVHLGIQIEQFMPDNGLSLSTPARRQPQSPIIVPPNSQIALTSSEMKHLFDHIPQSEISCPANLFSDYAKGKFGLLPEGQYRAHITAYRWSKPQMQTPVVVSSPTGGQCTFTVCYKAQAPRFLLPSTLASKDTDVAELDPLNALFSWTIPTITCNSSLSRYEYSLRVVEIPQGWSVTHALDRAPTVYQRDRLYVPQCIIPQNIMATDLMVSPDFDMKAIFLTNNILQSFLREKMSVWNDLMYVHRQHIMTLSDADMLFFTHFYDMLSLAVERGQDRAYRTDVIQSLLRAAILALCGNLKQMLPSNGETHVTSTYNSHFQRFLSLLHSSEVKYRPVKAYASDLCISPKYLTVICKKNSGKTATEWIQEHVLEDIRNYLKQTDLSIKQISDCLGFPNTSFFCKYVKEHFGIPPKRFREQ